MSIVRKILLGIGGSALFFFLFATAIDVGVVRIVGSPGPIKSILNDSGIYNSIVPSSLDQAKQISGGTSEISLTDPAVRTAAESTFDGRFLQSTTNGVIDSVYRWLNGQTAVPDFKIDLSAKKVEFADKVAAAVKQRASTLPRCTTKQFSEANFDAFSATCLPVGVTPAQVAANVRSDILNGKGFLDKTVITASDVKTEEICPGPSSECGEFHPQPFFTQNNQIPNVYHKLKATPLVLGSIAFLALLAVIFLSSSRLKGIKHAGFLLIGSGLFLLLFALSVNSVVNNRILPKISLTNEVLQTDVRKLVHDTTRSLDNTFLLFGGGYAALGALAVGGYYLRRNKHPAVQAAPADPDIKSEEPKPQASVRHTRPKSSPPKKIDVN